MVGNETAESAVVFVVDVVDAGLTEWAGLFGSSHDLVLVFVVIVAETRRSQLFFGDWRCSQLVLVEGDEVADNAVIEFERSFKLWQRFRIAFELSEDVVARFASSDFVRELTATPVFHLDFFGG